ncbi:MAG: T9SS type A sorting domain-containing protein [Bacteroidetes bacterium]|nr:T9SS type A sorting domain-containing protein [Bacteroidota bacterium]
MHNILKSQSAFRDTFIGKYNCSVKIQTSTQTAYENRFLYVSIDSNYINRIIIADSLWSPNQLIMPVNLYSDSTFKDTIWSSSGSFFRGNFYDLDSIYFLRVVIGVWSTMEYFGKKTPLGINEFIGDEFILYPNPSSELISIHLFKKSEGNTIYVTDLTGRIIKNNILIDTDNITDIDVSDFAAGIYFIHIQLNNSVVTKKIIVQH